MKTNKIQLLSFLNLNLEKPMVKSGLFGDYYLINLIGYIDRYDSQCSAELLSNDIDYALLSKAKGIFININSGGGHFSGISDLIEKIKSVDLPIVAYTDSVCASAAYWIASSANKIVLAPDATVGSVGVEAIVADQNQPEGYKKIKSKNAPGKNSGSQEEVQKIVDNAESIMLESIALNRGVTKEYVIENFGQGGLLTAAEALSNLMIDAIGSHADAVNLLTEMIMSKNAPTDPSATPVASAPVVPDPVIVASSGATPPQASTANLAAAADPAFDERARCLMIVQAAISLTAAEAAINDGTKADQFCAQQISLLKAASKQNLFISAPIPTRAPSQEAQVSNTFAKTLFGGIK